MLAKVMAAWTSEKLDGVNAAHAAWQDLGDRSEKHYHGPFFSGC